MGIEKVKVTVWQTTNLVIEESASTRSKEEIVGLTGADKTSFSTIPPTTQFSEVKKDYRVFESEVPISFEYLHWSYYLLIGFASLAFLVCLAQTLTCLYISLARCPLEKTLVCLLEPPFYNLAFVPGRSTQAGWKRSKSF